MSEDKKIRTEKDEILDSLDIIESQLTIITNVLDTEDGLYDDFLADKIKVVSRALNLIYLVQASLLKTFKANPRT